MNNAHRPAPKFSNPGRRARFSYITRDKDGTPVRRWHVRDDGAARSYGEPHTACAPAIAKSLRGMVTP